MSLRSDAARVWSLLQPERTAYAFGLFCLFLVNLADALAPVFMAVAIDLTEAALTGATPRTPQILEYLGLTSSMFSIQAAVALYLGFLLFANVARYPMLMHTAIPSHRIGQSIRNGLTAHLLKLSQSFYDRNKSGDLMSLATADIIAVRMMLGPGILVGADTVFIMSLVLLVMYGLSPELMLVAMIPLPVIALVTNALSHAEHKRFKDVQEDLAQLTERTRESFAGIRILQGYAREPYDEARFTQYSWRHYVKNMRLARVHTLLDPTLDLMIGISKVLVFVAGGLQVVSGEMALGTFVAFMFLVGFLSGPMIGLGWSVSLFQRGRASLARLDTLLATPVEIQDAPEATSIDARGGISIRNLSFAYQGPKLLEDDEETPETHKDEGPIQALENISVEVPAGQTLGVLGPVGSGKSTLARLLVRLYEPPEGSILLDNQDIRTITLDSLREHIVLAPQDTFLFSSTVERNVLMAAENDAQAETYTELASLHEELDALKEGYDTMLGERGVNLSGGQRQRLAIARAIAADPSVLILDDCLSAVDARTEEAILNNLRDVFDGRTGVIISHRVRAVQRCDQILVLEEGRVSELGSHEELMGRGGYYARIAQEQMDAHASQEAS